MNYKNMTDKNKACCKNIRLAYVQVIHVMETALTYDDNSIADSDHGNFALDQIQLAWKFQADQHH